MAWSTPTYSHQEPPCSPATDLSSSSPTSCPTGALYADGETYDRLVELSDTLSLKGNPWAVWAAELPDGRVYFHVLRDTLDENRPPSR